MSAEQIWLVILSVTIVVREICYQMDMMKTLKIFKADTEIILQYFNKVHQEIRKIGTRLDALEKPAQEHPIQEH